MKFSVCIPNYNYERFLGRTIQSILDSTDQDFEVLVSDNASTDGSVDVVKRFNDPRIRLRVNACNVGFSGNLDRAATMAGGQWLIMLSSDDLMRPAALATYSRLFDQLGERGESSVVSSSWDVIDADDRTTSQTGPDATVWHASDRKPELEAAVGAPVYGVAGKELLRRCLRMMKNPFNFAATVYPARLYRAVEGYGGGRLYNPDKWFHWRVLGQAEMAYFVDQRLFAYRWHASNQMAQEKTASALKFLVDEYVSTLEIDNQLLESVGMTRDELRGAFAEYDIGRHGLATLARGDRIRARQILDFGRATYPDHCRRNRKTQALRALLALGPLGQAIAGRAYRSYRQQADTPNGQ
ncbi:MAG: glycosyltransferase family 2 protein [Pirellulales bacterium]